ncbi:MAG: S-layer homology domain-containing protein [Actinomycetota bacterium]
MFLTRFLFVRLVALVGITALLAPATAHAHSGAGHDHTIEPLSNPPLFLEHDESVFEPIAAPFACGTEWSGTTRPGHGQNDWNLDFNRTSLNFGENRQHDLGQPLFAQADGTVTYIGWHVNAGTYMDIDYGDYAARYIHLVDDSVVASLGAAVAQGDTIALLGDTGNTPGFAHLHLEYWDSRGFDDARIWTLKQAGQPQTEVTFNDNVVDPREVIVSTNCVGDALEAGDPGNVPEPPGPVGSNGTLIGDVTAFSQSALEGRGSGGEGSAFVRDLIAADLTEALQPLTTGENDPMVSLHEFDSGVNIIATIPGGDRAEETVLIGANYDSPWECRDDEVIIAAPNLVVPCPGAGDNATGAALLLELAARIAAHETAPRRTLVLAFWDRGAIDQAGSGAWIADNPALVDTITTAVHYDVQGTNARRPLRRHTFAIGAESGTTDLVAAVDGLSSLDLQIHRLSAAGAGARDANHFTDANVPSVTFTDRVAPCTGTPTDTVELVDFVKLEHQVDAAEALVHVVANADIVGDPAEPLIDDSATIAAIAELAGVSATTLDELDTALLAADCAAHGSTAPIIDVPATSYARNDVRLLFDLGITRGTSDTTYSPGGDVTREQMAAFLARIWRWFHPDAVPSEPMPFVDVGETSFAYDDIRLLVELEITTGTTLTRYSPSDPVTREQMAAFLARIWRLLFPDLDLDAIEPHGFVDVADDSFAAEDIALIRAIEVTTGTSATTFDPNADVTREQMAAFLARLLRRHAITP